MKLSDLSPAAGSKRPAKRLGRGISAGQGKTGGRGVKGQHSRSGGYHKVGFEGGQMPLQRRLPKVGFRSPKAALTAQVRLSELNRLEADPVDLAALKAAHIVPRQARRAKVFVSGELTRGVNLKGITLTAGARKAVEAAGGSIED